MVDILLQKLDELVSITLKICVAATILILLVAFLRMQYRRFPRASKIKLAPRKSAQGIIFGWGLPGLIAYSPDMAEGHIAVIGGSGLGKTSSLLIPSLRSWPGPAFAIDISGDICKNIPGNKIVYAPLQENSCCYNPFARIDKLSDPDDQDEALEQLAYLLMPRPVKQSENSDFFITEGRKILTAALLSGYHSDKEFSEICRAVVTLGWVELFALIENAGYGPAKSYIKSFNGANEKNTAGCKQAAAEAVGLFARNKNVRNSLHRPESGETCFTPADLEQNKVFVVIPDEALEQLAPLLRLITAQVLEYISMRSLNASTTILMALDEFASLGALDILPALRKARKRRVRIMVLTQSLADLDLTYSKEATASMMANFRYKVLLDAANTTDQEAFAKLIGKYDATKSTDTVSGMWVNNRTITKEQRYIIEPDKLDNLENNLILLHPGGYTKLRKAFFFKGYF